MESRIPVPTDNIFKFYALFGLFLFVFACGAFLYVHVDANATLMASYPELEALREFEEPARSDLAQIAILEKRIEITKADKVFYIRVLVGVFLIAIFLATYGFVQWHIKIQPMLDETARVQLDIAKLQLEKLRQEVGTSSVKPVTSDPSI